MASSGRIGLPQIDGLCNPPFFVENIRCLVVIAGESGLSEHNPGLERLRKMAAFPNELGESKGASAGMAIRG